MIWSRPHHLLPTAPRATPSIWMTCLTLDDGENLVAEPPSMDDDSFNLDNLEDSAEGAGNRRINSENLFDDLDDLSNLS